MGKPMLQSLNVKGNKLLLSPIIDLFNGEIVSLTYLKDLCLANHQNAKNHSEK